MATKSKLEQAVEKQASNLNDAQRELVMSQFSVYKKNKARLAEIDSKLSIMGTKAISSVDELRFSQAQRSSLAYEKNQLETSNCQIASELFNYLEG